MQKPIIMNKKTFSYELECLYDGSSLLLKLKDLENNLFYQNQFSRDDLIKVCHRKTDFKDICDSLLFSASPSRKKDTNSSTYYSKHVSSEKQFEESRRTTNESQIGDETFGDTVFVNEIPCFKVEERGCIHVYTVLRNELTNQTRTYESVLKMNEMGRIESSYSKEKAKENDLEKYYESKLESLKQYYTNHIEKEKEKRESENELNLATIKKQTIKINSLKINHRELVAILFKENIREQANAHMFRFDGKMLECAGDGSVNQFMFFHAISNDEQFNFSIRIFNSEARRIKIGILDYQKQKLETFSSGSKNAVCYAGNSGYKYPNGGEEGSGFYEGETILIKVDRRSNSISWWCGSNIRASYQNNLIGDESRILVPFVEMENVGDRIMYL